jgi:hypothetical protein
LFTASELIPLEQNYVAGIRVVEAAGSSWIVQPHLGDLTSVEAGLTTTLGQFTVSWSSSNEKFNMTVSAPAGTKGTIAFPLFSPSNLTMQAVDVCFINGTVVTVHPMAEERYVLLPNMAGDSYQVNVTYVKN